MWRAFLSLWKNFFNYKDRATRKEFWLGALSQIIAMYVACLPLALIGIVLPFIPLPVLLGLFFTVILLPLLSLYVRRANDLNLSKLDIVLIALCVPAVGAMVMGLFPSLPADGKRYSLGLSLRLILIGFSLYFYGGLIGVLLATLAAVTPVVGAGLLLVAAVLIVNFVRMLRSQK